MISVLCCGHHSGKGRAVIAQENQWIVELDHDAISEDEDSIALDDRVETMGDRQNGAIFESLSQSLLDQSVRLRVDGRRGFVQQEYL
jgi:hypothetical protein